MQAKVPPAIGSPLDRGAHVIGSCWLALLRRREPRVVAWLHELNPLVCLFFELRSISGCCCLPDGPSGGAWTARSSPASPFVVERGGGIRPDRARSVVAFALAAMACFIAEACIRWCWPAYIYSETRFGGAGVSMKGHTPVALWSSSWGMSPPLR